MLRITFALLLIILSIEKNYSQNITGPELLRRTIAFHDPEDNWPIFRAELTLEQSRPDGTMRSSIVSLKNDESYFELTEETDGYEIIRTTISDSCIVTVNGNTDFSKEVAEKYRLSNDRVRRTRNYYVYLYGLPMKLTDQGTNIEHKVATVEFNGKEYLELKVTYDDDVGTDDWFFYIDPKTYAMEAYKFYHENGKGEYILLENLVETGGIKIPKLRKWYLTEGDRFLGADNLVSAMLIP